MIRTTHEEQRPNGTTIATVEVTAEDEDPRLVYEVDCDRCAPTDVGATMLGLDGAGRLARLEEYADAVAEADGHVCPAGGE